MLLLITNNFKYYIGNHIFGEIFKANGFKLIEQISSLCLFIIWIKEEL
jgi:hypothetical protein